VNAPYLRSVNVGQPRLHGGERAELTAIHKHAVSGPVLAHRLGIEGDQVADTEDHGGVDMAVYAFAREDLDRWGRELGKELPDGQFGENLTTVGLDVNEALVGEQWRIGEALFEIAKVRIPCSTFQRWMGESGVDNTAWDKRFTAENRPGPYLRVLEEGLIQAGDPIEVVHRPDHGITVSFMFRALTREQHLRPELLRIKGLAESVRSGIATD
jgi:MOSC domain-containing protein YiiM